MGLTFQLHPLVGMTFGIQWGNDILYSMAESDFRFPPVLSSVVSWI